MPKTPNQHQARIVGEKILDWARTHGRHDLPWQHAITPYSVWISEVMLQQTQVNKVAPFFQRFLTAFPSPAALASASEDEVLAQWSGLGYYSRARHLWQAARIIVDHHNGQLPCDLNALQTLPGLGRSTASAILAIGFQRRASILDGNVKRVLSRFFGVDGWPGRSSVQKRLWAYSEAVTPTHSPRAFTQAIMDFGASLCMRNQPSCHLCPLRGDCAALSRNMVAEIPAPRPPRKKPVRSTRFLIVRNTRQELLLVKNNQRNGVWRGLWLFPECRPDQDPCSLLATLFQLDSELVETLPIFRHTFSHYHLDIQPLVINAAGNTDCAPKPLHVRWHSHHQPFPGGVPTPVRRLIDHCTTSLHQDRKHAFSTN